MQKFISIALVTSFSIGFAGCAATPRGASEADLRLARAKTISGSDVYRRECAACHGERGEGRGDAPEVIGYGALPEYPRIEELGLSPAYSSNQFTGSQETARSMSQRARPPFRTAQDLYNYISAHRPLGGEGVDLEPADYWAVVNFLLVAHKREVPESGANPQNARTIDIR